MIKNQKLSAARAVRMPTLAEAMLDSLMTPSAATSAVTKAALVSFWQFASGCICTVQNSALSGAGYWTNTRCFADWHDIRAASRWDHNGNLSV